MVTGGSCGARPPSCSVVRVAPARRCGFVGAGPAAAALTVSPFLLWVGAPPRPWGGGGPRLWLPSWGGCGGGGGGGATPLALGPVWGGGWGGGALWSPGDASRRPGGRGGGGGGVGGVLRFPGDAPCRPEKGGGGGRLGGPSPGGQPSARGVAPFPRPPLPCAGSPRSPSLGPLTSRPLPRGAGRPGVVVRVSGQCLAGCGAAFPG